MGLRQSGHRTGEALDERCPNRMGRVRRAHSGAGTTVCRDAIVRTQSVSPGTFCFSTHTMSRFGYRSFGRCCSERFATAMIGTFGWHVRSGNLRRSCSRQTAALSSRNCASPLAAMAVPTSGTLGSHDDRYEATVRCSGRRLGTRWRSIVRSIGAMFAPVRLLQSDYQANVVYQRCSISSAKEMAGTAHT
jgi:hypothetical protein